MTPSTSTLLGLFCISAAMNQAFGLICYQCAEFGRDSTPRVNFPPCTPADDGIRLWKEVKTCEENHDACYRLISVGSTIMYSCESGFNGPCGLELKKYECNTDYCNTKEAAEENCSLEAEANREREREREWEIERERKRKENEEEEKRNPEYNPASVRPKEQDIQPKRNNGKSRSADKSSSWTFLASIVVLTMAGYLQIGGGVII